MSKLIAKIKDNDSNGEKSSKHHHSLSNIFHLHTDSTGSEDLTVKSITRKTRSRSNSLNKGGNGGGSQPGATPSQSTNRASRSNRHSLNSITGATANDRLRGSLSPLPKLLVKSQSMDHSLSVTSQPQSAISSNVGDISINNTMSAAIPRSTSTPLIHKGNDQSNTSIEDSGSPQPFPSVESPEEAAPATKHSSGFFSTMLSAISSPVPHEHTDDEKDKDHGTSISATNSHTNNSHNNNHNTLFSSKLDFLLKPAKFGKSKSSLPEDGQVGDKSEEINSNSDGRVGTSDNESKSFIGEDVPSASNVHFESIRESPLQTLGTGNLSLQFFEKNNNSSLKSGPENKKNDNTISFTSGDTNGESLSRAQSTSSKNRSTEKIDQLLANNDNLKRNLSPNAVNKLLPLKNQLAVSGTADNKKVRRKSFSTDGPNGTKAIDEESDDSFSSNENENNNGNQNQSGSFQDIGIQDYTDFKYASKKRNKEFHQNFKEVPRSERLIDDFSCAVSRDILVQGRIYLSPGYVCFNSNILGWVTNIIIPLQEVIQIEKKTTAVLFPNGMVIRTLHQKYVFATFISRDSFFSLITNVWHRVLLEGNEIDPTKLRKRMNTSVSSRRTKLSDEYSYSSDDEEYDEEEEEDEIHTKLENDVDVDTLGIVDSDEDITHNTNGASQKETSSGDNSNAAVTDTNRDLYKGLPIIGPSTHAPTENGYEKSPSDTFICEETLEAPMGAIFRILFGDGTDKYITILKEQKNFDITESSITALSNNSKERKYSYIKPLGGSIGPKQTKCNITDTLIDFSIDSSILVEQVSRTPDVPSGSSFSVKTKIYLSWAPNNATKIYVVTSIEWTAKSWIKGAIEKGSIDGQKESMKSMMATLNKFIKTAQSSSEGSAAANSDKKKKKKKISTVKQEDTPVVEKQEPEPPKTIINQVYDLFASIGDSVPISIPFINSASSGFIYTVVLYLVILTLGSMLLHLVGFGGSSSLSYGIGLSGNMPTPDDFISRIKINGNEYSIVQTVDSTLSNGKLARNTEISMWEWIRDRSEGKIDLNESGSSKHEKPINWSSDYSKLKKKYSKDDIEEMLAMTRMKLDEIQQQISGSGSSA